MTAREEEENRSGILWAKAALRFHGLPEPVHRDTCFNDEGQLIQCGGHFAPGIVDPEDYLPEWGIWRRTREEGGEA